MKNILIKVPEVTEFSQLPQAVVDSIAAIMGQWAVIGVPFGGEKILDCITSDEFNATLLPPDWVLYGEWQWDGVSTLLTERLPVNAGFIDFMPPAPVYDQSTGDVLSYDPPDVIKEIHVWSGWPRRF